MAWGFGSNDPAAEDGVDLHAFLAVGYEDLYRGMSASVPVRVPVPCPHCNGRRCQVCGFAGRITEDDWVPVTIPRADPNSRYGARLRFPGRGGRGLLGGHDGDLYVQLVPPPVNGEDVVQVISVTGREFALGFNAREFSFPIYVPCPVCTGFGCNHCGSGLVHDWRQLLLDIPAESKRSHPNVVVFDGLGCPGRFGGETGSLIVELHPPPPPRYGWQDIEAYLVVTEAELRSGATKSIFVETNLMPCPQCGGSRCATCEFRGSKAQRWRLQASIAAGDLDNYYGFRQRRPGEGGFGFPGEPPRGDLYVQLVSPAELARQGIAELDDVTTTLQLSHAEYMGETIQGLHYPARFRCEACRGRGCNSGGPGGCEGKGYLVGSRNPAVRVPPKAERPTDRPGHLGLGHDSRTGETTGELILEVIDADADPP